MHPSRTSGTPVAYSSTGDVSGTYRARILGSRPWIRMYAAPHQKEQELGTVRSSTYRLCGRIEDQFSRCELTGGRKPAETNIGGVCDMCMCLARGRWEVLG